MQTSFARATAIILLLSTHSLIAQTFTSVSPGLGSGTFGYLVTADLDNDADPDIVVTGSEGLMIFKNNAGTFNTSISFPDFPGESQIPMHSLDVGDINKDGTIDILQGGGPNTRVFRILINNNFTLTDISDNILGGFIAGTYLGDFDNDGDLDVIYSGQAGGILVNSNGKFINGPWFTNWDTWYANWCDLDQDSQLEVIQSVGGSNYFKSNYRLEKAFPAMRVDKTLSISPFILNAVYADYDHDGDLDMLAKISDGHTIFNNVGGELISSSIQFPAGKTAEFADINNDGLYDVVIGGTMPTWQQFETAVYINQDNGTFLKLNPAIPGCENCSAIVADIDNDGDLDIPTMYGVFRNNSNVVNDKPGTPVITDTNVSGTGVSFSWQAGTDDKTPVQSLTYNIHVRSEDGSIISPGHSLASGKRQLYKAGNVGNKLSFDLSCLKQGKYYWKVQTIDAAYQGSSFSAEQEFTITKVPPVAPGSLTATTISDVQIDLDWTDESATEDEYIILKRGLGSDLFYTIDTVPANSTHYSDVMYMQASTFYEYSVVASNCAYPDQAASVASATTFPPAFVNSEWLNLGSSRGSMVLMGDYDNDGDLDLLLNHDGAPNKTKLYRFDGNGYVDSNIQLPSAGFVSWIDFNNDGYIDILLGNGTLYKNIQGTDFQASGTLNFPPYSPWLPDPSFSFADFDNDGDEDMLKSNSTIYENNGKGNFKLNTSITLSNYLKSTKPWADFDRDGDFDIIGSKQVTCYSYIIVIHRNNGNKTFTTIEYPNLEGLNDDLLNSTGEMSWGDYDQDGYPDIIVAGQNGCGNGYSMTKIYHNNGDNTFTPLTSLVQENYEVNVDWGDYDNDGDLDLFVYGDPFGAYSERTRIYRNDGTTFKETNIDYLIESVQYGSATRGDIEGDGDLDYVILGQSNYTTPSIIVYRNTYAESWGKKNDKPSAPTGLSSTVNSHQSVTLSWNNGSDVETMASGLTYNMYLVDESDSVITNSYSLPDGTRKIVGYGNLSSRTSMTLNGLQPGVYRWAVQSVDNGFMGSSFSFENSFEIIITSGEGDAESMLRIYPNPAKNILTVENDRANKKTHIEMTDMLGRSFINLSTTESMTTIDISGLPGGLYFVTVFDGLTKLQSKKIVKVN